MEGVGSYAGCLAARNAFEPHGRLVQETVDDGVCDQSDTLAIGWRQGFAERLVLTENLLRHSLGVLAQG
jgi:hypothetical protein